MATNLTTKTVRAALFGGRSDQITKRGPEITVRRNAASGTATNLESFISQITAEMAADGYNIIEVERGEIFRGAKKFFHIVFVA